MTEVLAAAARRDLARSFQGEIVDADMAAYDEHRAVWNGSIDRRPAVIARCTSLQDVVAAVAAGHSIQQPVAVRGGGHSFPGLSTGDDVLVIDLSPMNAVEITPDRRIARVQAGALLGDVDRATQPLGLAVPSGIVTHTGVAGLTLGGGIGWVMRKYGLTIDNLLEATVVTASGEVVRASHDENADLFWGLRGGGGNFGIVTDFTFQLQPVGPTVLAGPIFWHMRDAEQVLRFYREWIQDAPDELMTIVVHRKAPALDVVPTELHGEPVITVICCYVGPIDEGEAVVRPLRAFGNPVLDLCQAKPFLTHQSMFDPSFRPGWWYYMRACDVAELTDDVVEITVAHASEIASPLTAFPIWQMGGAVARVPEDETAFHGRGVGHTFNITAATESSEGFEFERDWVRRFWSALAPYHTSVYVNFLMEEGEERVRQAYGEAKYERLKRVKQHWDPTNFFRLNQNIPPG